MIDKFFGVLMAVALTMFIFGTIFNTLSLQWRVEKLEGQVTALQMRIELHEAKEQQK